MRRVSIAIVVVALGLAAGPASAQTTSPEEPSPRAEASSSEGRAAGSAQGERRATAAPLDPVGPIILASVGAVLFVGGLTTFMLGKADRDAVEGASIGSRWDDYSDRASRGPVLLGVGQITGAAGVILMTSGLVWLGLVLAGSDPDPFGTADRGRPVDLEFDLGPGGVSLRGRF